MKMKHSKKFKVSLFQKFYLSGSNKLVGSSPQKGGRGELAARRASAHQNVLTCNMAKTALN